MVKNEKTCCKGSVAVGKILAVAGMYILTWGLIGSAAWRVVLSSSVFWGLILLAMSRCAIMQAHRAEMCKA